MADLLRGQRVPLAALSADGALVVAAEVVVPGVEVDLAAFAVDSTGRLVDDAWFVFYNQNKKP